MRAALALSLAFCVSLPLSADDPPSKTDATKPPVKDVKQPPESDKPQTVNGLPLLFKEDFEDGKADGWEPTDTKAWNVRLDGKNRVYNLFKRKSNYKPKVRSPYNISLRKGLTVGDFVLDVKFKSTVKDYGHRSLCLFFGYQDPTHFYYVHFGKKADAHANQIFIVNDKPRTKISLTTTPGTPWDDKWHTARIVRKAEEGVIEVYFDDMKKPVMTAKDSTFKTGRIGVGSFDDTGWFDDIRVYAKK